MTSTSHTLVGAAIACAVPNTFIAAPLVIASHFLMDLIPHWDFGTNWRNRPKHLTGIISISDTIIGFTVAYFLFGGKAPFLHLTLNMFLSVLPDWLETPWYIFFAQQKKFEPGPQAGILEKLSFSVYKYESLLHTKAQYPFGLYTQIATVLFFLVLLSF